VSFDDTDLGARLDALLSLPSATGSALDALPFGVIRVDATGRVAYYSATESRQSGLRAHNAVGLDFFAQLAPCMNTPRVRGRIVEAAQRGAVDIEVGHTGDFADPDRFLRVRVVSAGGGGYWHCHLRE
jgi:photoactive yellow protein